MTNNLIKAENKNTITSLEIVEQINIFRREEGNRTELQHSDLLKIIRNEFEEEIGLGKISESSYLNSQNKRQPMFELTLNQAKQILMRESKFVRKAMIQYIEKLENVVQQISNKDRLLLGLFSTDPMIVADSHKKLVQLEVKPLQDKIEKDKPKVELVDSIIEEDNYFDARQLASMLNKKDMGRNNLLKFLREKNIIDSHNVPYRQYVEQGLVKQIPTNKLDLWGNRIMKTVFSIKMLNRLVKYFAE